MEKKPNIFSRILIIILIVFIGVLVISSFVLGKSKFSLTYEIILLIVILVFLSLSEVFDNFSIGNLITAKKEKHEKEVELKEVKNENRELRTQLINIASNSISNKNMNIFGLSKDGLVQVAGVEEAESSAVEENKEEEFVAEIRNSRNNRMKLFTIFPQIKKFVLDQFCTQYKIPVFSVVKDIKFSNQFIGIDPIMDKNVIFDAYYKSIQEELFIIVKLFHSMKNLTQMYNFYYFLSKIYYYRNSNQLQAKMVLIIPNLPDSYYRVDNNSQIIAKIQETFAPAIKNNLLEIVPIQVTEKDLETIIKEFEE